MGKLVSKLLKTWYFANSTCQWGGAIALSGYATANMHAFKCNLTITKK